MILEWLPDKKYYEYAYHKFHNPSVKSDLWTPWDQWTYPDRDILRFENIIHHQLDHIKNKKVLDVACHLGYLSLFCLHNNAKFVTGTNIRQRELDIADEICSMAGYSNYSFKFSDLYDLDQFKNYCDRHDTIIMSGILYHVNNHYELLKTVALSNAKTLIIESQLDGCLVDEPTMSWHFESTDNPTNGFEKTKSSTFVGVPSRRWIEHALVDLEFDIVYNNIIEYVKETGFHTTRCILTGTKKT